MTPTPDIERAITGAAQATGVSASLLRATAARESAFDPQARAQTSTASGLFQFIEQTWLTTLKNHGDALGLGDVAAKISRGSDGRARVSDPVVEGALLSLRFDPAVSSLMAGALARDNAEALEAGLGRAPSDGEIYVAHFLGARGATDLLTLVERDPGASAAEAFPAAARANRSIFYHRDGTERSAAEVVDRLTADFTDAPSAVPSTAAPADWQPVSILALTAVEPTVSATPTGYSRSPYLVSSVLIEALASMEPPRRRDDR